MTKKDFQAIARAIYSSRLAGGSLQALAQRSETMQAIADVLQTNNPRFDRARFVEACETGGRRTA